jgi:hypothetical protein
MSLNPDKKFLLKFLELSKKEQQKAIRGSMNIIKSIKKRDKNKSSINNIKKDEQIRRAVNKLANSLAKGKRNKTKRNRKQVRINMMGNLKKRNKLRIKVLKKTCKLRRKKIRQNKFLKKKKSMIRLTKKLCKHKKIVKKIHNKIQTLKMKYNKAYK